MFARALITIALLFTPWANADNIADDMLPISEYGLFYKVPEATPLGEDSHFKIAFDVADPADLGSMNFNINSLARFLNMHVAHGVPKDNIDLALVVHGEATLDLLTEPHFKAKFNESNRSEGLVMQLLEQGVEVYLCGQSATHFGVNKDNMIPGVTLSLSAMTAHAQLQQKGFTLNPF